MAQYRVKEGKVFFGVGAQKHTAGQILPPQHPSIVNKGLRFDEIEVVPEEGEKKKGKGSKKDSGAPPEDPPPAD